jgi:signal transduction histidine kinase/ActR/RegA family two-component response regulator
VRTKERVLIDTALGADPFPQDEYLRQRSPKSVLCLPLLKQGVLVGVLYLENSLVPGAFSADRTAVLELLASQAAISLENATLYADLQREQTAIRELNLSLEQRVIERTNELQAERDRADEASRSKSVFLANMSHELRTPLNSLLILAKLLADNTESNLSPKQVEFAETIHGAGSDLLQLINDILDLSKVEAGKMDVSPTRIALVQLVDYVEATFRPLTVEKGLDFSVSVSPELPATLHTDEQRLLQVLRNLLSNAVKFTDSGAVELVIRSARDDVPDAIREQMLEHGSLRDPSAEMIAFSVTDTGIGIAQSKMLVIFEAFKQADGTTSRKYGGTGLGLSISQEIARLLGGEIYAASEPGRGSTFTLYLPLHPTELPPQGYGQHASSAPLSLPEARTRAGAGAGAAAAEAAGEALAGEAGAAQAGGEGAAHPESEQTAEEAAHSLADRRRLRDASGQAQPELPPEARPSHPAAENGVQPVNGAATRSAAHGAQPGGAVAENGGEPVRAAEAQAGAPGGEQAPSAGAGALSDLAGRKVLIVDDDIRNVFALTSVLEQHGLQVLYAENGREGIEVLEQHDDAAVVLMDIMMPEMDGYATTAAIRKMPQFAGLPIIALTAKAMKGDREKSIESGASDYVTKPVDTDHLLDVMRRWMDGG